MKSFLSLLITLSVFSTYAQKDTTTMVAHDNSITWTVYLSDLGNNNFSITTIGRPHEGKQLSDAASIMINNTYGVTVDPRVDKEKGNDGQLSLTRKLYISKKDRYVITGSVNWYIKGEKDIRKRNFRLVFTND